MCWGKKVLSNWAFLALILDKTSNANIHSEAVLDTTIFRKQQYIKSVLFVAIFCITDIRQVHHGLMTSKEFLLTKLLHFKANKISTAGILLRPRHHRYKLDIFKKEHGSWICIQIIHYTTKPNKTCFIKLKKNQNKPNKTKTNLLQVLSSTFLPIDFPGTGTKAAPDWSYFLCQRLFRTTYKVAFCNQPEQQWWCRTVLGPVLTSRYNVHLQLSSRWLDLSGPFQPVYNFQAT